MKHYTEMNEIRRKFSCESTFIKILNYSAHGKGIKELDDFSHSFLWEVESISYISKTEVVSIKIFSFLGISRAVELADSLKLGFLLIP